MIKVKREKTNNSPHTHGVAAVDTRHATPSFIGPLVRSGVIWVACLHHAERELTLACGLGPLGVTRILGYRQHARVDVEVFVVQCRNMQVNKGVRLNSLKTFDTWSEACCSG